MIGPRATLSELTGALEAAGVGVYLYEGARRSQRWLAGAARFGDVGRPEASALIADRPPGDALRVADVGRGVDEHLVRLEDDAEGGPRFLGVVRAAEGARDAQLLASHREGRSGLQAQLTHLGETLPTEALVVCAAFSIDGMREFVRAYGYDAGDALALSVGRRLAALLPRDVAFARVAGAKFGAILLGESAESFRARAAGIGAAMREESFDVGFGPVSVTLSIGATLSRPDLCATPEPFDAALAALDEAAGEGEGGLHIADPTGAGPALSPSAMRAGARAVMLALEQDRVAIAFQPVVTAATPDCVAFRECLARVRDEDGRWISAGMFLPKIERLDLIRALDRRVLGLALAALRAHPTERLSVNVSVRTMRDRAWLRDLTEAAADEPGVVERLIVELTESSAVEDADRTKAFLDGIRALGVAIALDDFGAGYSSFRLLRDFRPDWVKIDGGFVKGVADDPDNKLFVDTLVGIARNFEMGTVAEFVETDAEAETLRALGVDCLQGYRFGRPVMVPDWPGEAALRAGG